MKFQQFSKLSKFYLIGASGLFFNYVVSFLLKDLGMWYLYSNIGGIIFSMHTNFLLNKIWTFKDHRFSVKITIIQYIKFIGFSSISAMIQVILVYFFVEYHNVYFSISLLISVLLSGFINFTLNKKITFKN